jgi:hypothetical protein
MYIENIHIDQVYKFVSKALIRNQMLGLQGFGLSALFGIVKNRTFQKLDEFPSSGEWMVDTYSVGPVRKS